MTKTIKLSLTAIMAVSTLSFAGGDIIPVYEPVVAPEAVQYDTVSSVATPIYAGVGFNRGVYHNECKSGCVYEDTTYGVTLRGGYDINEYVGVEARYIGTFWDADELGGQELTHVGLYVKPMIPVNGEINIYGLAGYGMTQTTTGGNGNLTEIDDTGFSAGIGLEFNVDTQNTDDALESGWGLFVDYQRLLIKSDVPTMDVVSGGVTFNF